MQVQINMKILFSPSETKFSGGKPLKIEKSCFIFPKLFEKRIEALNYYQNYINTATPANLEKLFGTKKKDLLERYKTDIFSQPLMKAVQRYDGIAYDYLKYTTLSTQAQNYIDANTIIFSNLLGPLKASDAIPEYKFKQGEKLGDIALEKFYCDHFTKALDEYLQDEDVIDLRAGFYEKFYKITQPYTTMKFIKDGKVVSHWAKAYRGIVLREMAKNDIQTIEQLMDMEVENLTIQEIKKQKNKTEIVYTID